MLAKLCNVDLAYRQKLQTFNQIFLESDAVKSVQVLVVDIPK